MATSAENNLQKYLALLPQKKALVIGDVMLDRFVYGAINRMSPESDAAVLDVRRETIMPGGAGNVAANLKALGIGLTLIGAIGTDEAGKTLSNLLGAGEDLIILERKPTTTKTRFLDSERHLLRVDEEDKSDLLPAEEDALLEKAKSHLANCDIVILSDYNKGVLTKRVIREIIQAANDAGIAVLADPKKEDFTIYSGATILTPNRKELALMTGMGAHSNDEILKAAQTIMDKAAIQQIVVTRSEDGMSVFTKDCEPYHIAATTSHAVDVSGAGDTVIAGLAAATAAGAPLKDAATLANHAAGLAVAQSGTSRISADEIHGALDGQIAIRTDHKDRTREAGLYSKEEAATIIADWKSQGLAVGFTNGCFDILHFGHVSYLNRARDKCDRLVVGLNHDQSVKLLKGPERPLHDENSRAAVLGALGSVDMVVLFGATQANEDNTPCAVIEAIKPDIFFKGGDYTIDQLPEAKIMEKIGGKVELMPLYEGHSTTSTVEKMKKSGTS